MESTEATTPCYVRIMPRALPFILVVTLGMTLISCDERAETKAEGAGSQIETLNRLHRAEVADLKAKIASLESENAAVSAKLEETEGLYDYLVRKVSAANIAEDKRLHPDLYSRTPGTIGVPSKD